MHLCGTCLRSKPTNRKGEATQLSYIPGSPFERVHFDSFGPVSPISNAGCRYALLIRDLFSRFTVMVGLPDQTAKIVAKGTLQQWTSYFGVPDALHSDRGSCFEADLYKKILQNLRDT